MFDTFSTRVRRHFRFEAKRSETEAKSFSLRSEKKSFFSLCSHVSETLESEAKMKAKRTLISEKKK